MISIVGAGPAGAFAASILAKKGFKVDIFEDHKSIGSPVQCTGLVTNSIAKLIKIDEDCIINKIDKVRIYAPDGNFISLRFKESNLVLDRSKFDRFIAEKAIKSGTVIHLQHKAIDYRNNVLLVKDIKKDKLLQIRDSIVIGADGPLSIISKSIGNKKQRFWVGLQYRIKYENSNEIEFYPYLGTFVWIVPENRKIARVGIIGHKYLDITLNDFLREKLGKGFKKRIIEVQGGLVPRFNPKIKLQKGKAFLVGDAATLVKATTAGGIIQSLESSKILADSIIRKKNYPKEIRKKMHKDLFVHLYMRNVMDKFSKKDWNRLVRYFSTKRMKKVLENMDRDYPSKMIPKMLINNPKILYFIKYIL